MTEVVVRGKESGFAQAISARSHYLQSDEPVTAGGSDTGPTPYELLLASLGSCTSMTIGMYARRKAWLVESITVTLRHSRVYAEDCENCESKDVMLDRIERDIVLLGQLTVEQRAKLLEIANKCPVHRTLQSKIDIQTRML